MYQYWVIFCFECKSFKVHAKLYIKMNEIVTKFLLAGNKFMPEMHLKQPGVTYSACERFTKNKERIQNLKKNKRYKLYLQK